MIIVGWVKTAFGWIKGIMAAGAVLKNLVKIRKGIKEVKQMLKQFRATMDAVKKAKADKKWTDAEIDTVFDEASKLIKEITDVFEILE